MADVGGFENWSATAASNSPSGSTAIGSGLDDNLREIQAQVREWLATASTIASAATTDLSTVGARFISVTGTTTITAFGTLSAGIDKVLIFAGALTLTHNATSLILPTGANITTAAGDVATFVSLGSGNWRCTGYLRASGDPLTAGRLSGLTAANAANTIANGDNAQVWQWALSTASKVGFKLTESAASTGSGAALLEVGTVATSTADPLVVKARTNTVLTISEVGAVTILGPTSATTSAPISITAGSGSSSASGDSVTIAGGDGGASGGNGGEVNISGGESPAATGGAVTITSGDGGAGSGDTSGNITISTGTALGTTWFGGNINITANAGTADDTAQANVNISATNSASDDTRLSLLGEAAVVCHHGITPSITSGAGSGASIAGNKNGFQITVGTGHSSGTPIVISLHADSARIPNPPLGFVNYRNGTTACRISASTDTSVSITSASNLSSGDKLDVLLFYYE